MARTIFHFTKYIVVVWLLLIMTSCKYTIGNQIEGNGKVKTENREINDPFSKIKVSQGIHVIVEQANNTSVTINADENLLQYISTRVEHGVLIISTNKSYETQNDIEVNVKMPIIDGFDTSSASLITNLGKLKGNKLELNTSSGSEITLESIEFAQVNADASSGSKMNLEGKTFNYSVDASSGSSINSENLLANTIIAKTSSGSSLDVHPLVSLTAKASSGSSINYDGSPKNVTQDSSSGASIQSTRN